MNNNSSSVGATPTERTLFKLCRETFLNLWSFANVYRNQGIQAGGQGKELCDVLVVFGNSVILFSDKSCQYPDSGVVSVDWSRWYRRAIRDSQRQLSGAERWIRQFPDRVFRDPACTTPLEVRLPDQQTMRVFKVSVATGASEACKKYFGGGSGSLMLQSPLHAASTNDILAEDSDPFVIPIKSRDGEVVHVLNEVTLPVLLGEFDTISDFVEYLEAKERFVSHYKSVLVHGEEELIGLHIGAQAGLDDCIAQWECPTVTAVGVAEGIYSHVRMQPAYKGYVRENRSSYLWDKIINTQSQCVVKGDLLASSKGTIVEHEALLRILASEPRLRRRFLVDAYLEIFATRAPNQIASRTLLGESSTVYVVQVYPFNGGNYDKYRRIRLENLCEYCLLTAWRHRDRSTVVGMVTKGTHVTDNGYDLIAVRVDEWTPDLIEFGEQLNREFAKKVIAPQKKVDFYLRYPDRCGNRLRKSDKPHNKAARKRDVARRTRKRQRQNRKRK